MFKKGDKLAHPVYGAGIVSGVEQKMIDGQSKPYYVLNIPVNNLSVMLPESKLKNMRNVHDKKDLMNMICKTKCISPMTTNRTEFYANNLEKVKSGNISKVTEVFKYLSKKERSQVLPVDEKRLLNSSRQIILSEIIISHGVQKSDAEKMLQASLENSPSDLIK